MRLYRRFLITSGLPVIRSGSSVSRQARCSKIKRTSINVDIESGIVAMFGSGRSEDQLLAMLRGQLTDIVFGAVHRIDSLLHCRHRSMQRRTPHYLVRNMEGDVGNRTLFDVAAQADRVNATLGHR